MRQMKSAKVIDTAVSINRGLPVVSLDLTNRTRQRGAVLLVGMIMLLVITVMGISSISSVTMEERMVSNMQNARRAFQGAEAALSVCERFVRDSTPAAMQVNSGVSVVVGQYDTNWTGAGTWWDAAAFWATNGRPAALTGAVAAGVGLTSQPTCVYEYVGKVSSLDLDDKYLTVSPGSKEVFRVTTHSFGGDVSTQAVIESFYVK